MCERAAFCLLALSALVQSETSVFFHEPSAILMEPGGEPNNQSDFGFAIGHWKETLIVGSPHSNFIGEVYRCPISTTTSETGISCNNLDFNIKPTDYFRGDRFPNQNFYLGSTIATTEDYLFVCAPMVTKSIHRSYSKKSHEDAMGSCFICDDSDVNPYMGPDDRFISDGSYNKTSQFQGGTGWSTLADKENGFLIIAKTSVAGDINYLRTKNPQAMPVSIMTGSNKNEQKLASYVNIGYGLTSGRFFSKKKTVYAVSMQTYKMTGEIIFMEQIPYQKQYLRLVQVKEKAQNNQIISKMCGVTNSAVGAMFGYTLGAADLNLDGWSELLVGAPAQSDDEGEYGALHIYLGGESCNKNSGIRTIFGAKCGGRFGTTIAACDVDGDNIPEIFVSAPYEDSGVVYILSGYELNRTLISSEGIKQVTVTQLNYQRVQRSDLKLFGFSLHVVPDIDGNGCDEIAIGAPGSASVLLYRSFQTVNVTVTLKLIGAQNVRDIDKAFSVSMCLNVGYNMKSAKVSGIISAMSYIEGPNVIIHNPKYDAVLLQNKTEYCDVINVTSTQYEKAKYTLYTKLKLKNVNTLKPADFDPSWVQFSPYSVKEAELGIKRLCNGDDCKPHLSMDMWSNGSEPYELGSSETKNVTVKVTNTGFAAYDACVLVNVQTGGRVSLAPDCESKRGFLECRMPSPLQRYASQTFDIVLNMTKLTNKDIALIVSADLYEHCNLEKHDNKMLNVSYSHDLEKKHVSVDGAANGLSITDKEILDNDITSFKDVHEYSIINNGLLTWEDIRVDITVRKESFIERVGSTETDNCNITDNVTEYTISCTLSLQSRDTKKVVARAELSKKEVGDFLYRQKSGKEMKVVSAIYLYLDPNNRSPAKSLESRITLKKELSFGNNWLLIIIVAVILALLVLAIITYILYKNDFFKRKQKKRLDVLRDSVRRRSIRLASVRKQSQKTSSGAEDDHMDLEVVDDCPFPEIPLSPNDDTVLIESQAQVHHHKPNNHTG